MRTHRWRFPLIGVLVALATTLLVAPAQASTLNSLYVYDLRTVAGSQVANTAAANPGANLTLFGTWSSVPTGVNFVGDTVSQQSVGYYKPATGKVLNLTAAQSLAFGVQFTYQAPVGALCFGDSPNLTQIGRFADHDTQAKLQFTKCGHSNGNSLTQVFMQCRMAGLSTPSSVLPVTSTLALVAGNNYLSTCTKTPDNGSTNTVTLSVTLLDPVNGNQTTTNTFTVAALGAMSSTQYLSVANKYKLPAQYANTDQYNGPATKVVYCSGATVYESTGCLAAELPVSY